MQPNAQLVNDLAKSIILFLYVADKILKSRLFLRECVVTTIDVCRWETKLEQQQQGRTTFVPVWTTLSPIWTLILFQDRCKIVFELGMNTHGTLKECWVRIPNSSYLACLSERGCTDTDIEWNSHFSFSELHVGNKRRLLNLLWKRNYKAIRFLLLHKFYSLIQCFGNNFRQDILSILVKAY